MPRWKKQHPGRPTGRPPWEPRPRGGMRLLRLLAVAAVWVFVSVLLMLCAYAVVRGVLDRIP